MLLIFASYSSRQIANNTNTNSGEYIKQQANYRRMIEYFKQKICLQQSMIDKEKC